VVPVNRLDEGRAAAVVPGPAGQFQSGFESQRVLDKQRAVAGQPPNRSGECPEVHQQHVTFFDCPFHAGLRLRVLAQGVVGDWAA
jgi:hypothetical protein